MMVKTKYQGEIDFNIYREHCVNNIFKLLPLMEQGQKWRAHLSGFLVEISGIAELTSIPQFIALLGKLEGLNSLGDEQGNVEDQALFRKIVLDSISLVKSIEVGEE